MWTNYLTVALRTLRRNASYTLINVLGLAAGLAVCFLIGLYVWSELSYDRFHANADRLARLVRETSASSAAPMGPALARELPGVEQAARIASAAHGGVSVERADGQQFEEAMYMADSTVFDLFSFAFVRGGAETALRRPDALVLTETAARKYFGEADPMGRTLTIHADQPVTLTVTGVLEDLPATSHFRFDLMGSFELVAQQSNRMDNWETNWLFTYLLLARGTIAEEVEARLPAFFERHTGEAWSHFRMQPLLDVHLHSTHMEYDIAPQSDATYVYLSSVVAVLILLIACINFMNLATARSMRRAREVGMRKVLGARRTQLAVQFLGEALLTTLLAVVLAAGLVWVLLPLFRDLTGQAVSLPLADPRLLAAVALGLLGVGLLAGSYPAFFLSGFRPAQALKGEEGGHPAGGTLRRGLVVFQFAVSAFLIACTLVVYQQIDYVQNARLGFDKEQTLVLTVGEDLADRYEVAKRAVLQHPNVRAAAATANVPGQDVSDFYYRPEGGSDDDLPGADTYFIDTDYAETLGLELVRGRGFSTETASDTSGFLINETAQAVLAAEGGPAWDDPVGKLLDFYVPGPEGWEVMRSGPVIGVVKDFHYRSLHAEIGPLVLQVVPPTFDKLLVKVGTDDLAGTLAYLEEQWQVWGPDQPFDYVFLDASFDRLYRTEQRVGTLFGLFAGLAILIACLGLFGLAAYATERRTKEIGVRKVLGASVPGVVLLLSREFLQLVALAFLLALPAAYVAMNRWLESFAYHVDVTWHPLLVAGLAALSIALLTVGYQATKAALADPVDSLRYE